MCVESTVRDAMARDFHCIVVEDAVAEPIGAGLARSNHEASMLTMELLFAWITNSEQIVDALRRSPLDAVSIGEAGFHAGEVVSTTWRTTA